LTTLEGFLKISNYVLKEIFSGRGRMKIYRKSSAKDSRGFTLIELLVVMVIIGLLAALVAPRLFPKLGKGKQSAAKAQIELLGQALDQYRLDTGSYPTTQEGLNALVANPGVEKWEGPYLKKALPLDPWGKPYIYQNPGTHGEYDLYSYGRDNKPGGDGEDKDVTNWD
jgi:general secretion pathway protein G